MRSSFVYSRRHVVAAAAALLASGGSTSAAAWPIRSVTTLVPYGAGGSTDMLARLAGQILSQQHKQPFVVDNRAGGSGVAATAAVASALPDGHTLLLSTPAQMITVPLLQKVPYDPTALTPISNFGNYPLLFGIKASLPANTFDEFIAYARRFPGKLNYASAGSGVLSHLAAALFCVRADVDMVHVPYKGAAPAMAALLGGEVDMFCGTSSDLAPHLGNDRVRVLATAGETRFSAMPDLPRVSERFPGFIVESWNGYIGPPGMAPGLVAEIAASVIAVLKHPIVAERMRTLAVFPVGSSPAEFAQTIARDREFYTDAIKAARI